MNALITTFNAQPATGFFVLVPLALLVYFLNRQDRKRNCKAQDLHGGTHNGQVRDPYEDIKKFRGEA